MSEWEWATLSAALHPSQQQNLLWVELCPLKESCWNSWQKIMWVRYLEWHNSHCAYCWVILDKTEYIFLDLLEGHCTLVLVYLLSHVWLFCQSMDCSPSASSVYGISQAGILELVAISFSKKSYQLRDRTWVSWIGRWILYHWDTFEASSYII